MDCFLHRSPCTCWRRSTPPSKPWLTQTLWLQQTSQCGFPVVLQQLLYWWGFWSFGFPWNGHMTLFSHAHGVNNFLKVTFPTKFHICCCSFNLICWRNPDKRWMETIVLLCCNCVFSFHSASNRPSVNPLKRSVRNSSLKSSFFVPFLVCSGPHSHYATAKGESVSNKTEITSAPNCYKQSTRSWIIQLTWSIFKLFGLIYFLYKWLHPPIYSSLLRAVYF